MSFIDTGSYRLVSGGAANYAPQRHQDEAARIVRELEADLFDWELRQDAIDREMEKTDIGPSHPDYLYVRAHVIRRLAA